MKQPYRFGGPSRPPRRPRRFKMTWTWRAVVVAMVAAALVRAWQMWQQVGKPVPW